MGRGDGGRSEWLPLFFFFFLLFFFVVVPLAACVAVCDVFVLFLVHHFFHCFVAPVPVIFYPCRIVRIRRASNFYHSFIHSSLHCCNRTRPTMTMINLIPPRDCCWDEGRSSGDQISRVESIRFDG
jgi:hypothetical protein